MEKRENVLLPLSDFNEEAYGDIRENAVENGRLIKEAFKGSFDIIGSRSVYFYYRYWFLIVQGRDIQ